MQAYVVQSVQQAFSSEYSSTFFHKYVYFAMQSSGMITNEMVVPDIRKFK